MASPPPVPQLWSSQYAAFLGTCNALRHFCESLSRDRRNRKKAQRSGIKAMSKGEVVMKTLTEKVAKWTAALAVIPFGLFLSTAAEARAGVPACENSPMVKNLMAPTYRAPCTQALVHEELNKEEVKRLAATAESSADHLK